MNNQDNERNGFLFGLATYLMWGFMPPYFKQLQSVPATQILLYRIVLSFLLLVVILLIKRQMPAFLREIKNRRIWLIYFFAASILGVNWLTYIWAINSGHIIDSSLGYYINPLLSVLLSVLVLKEKLRKIQWAAIALAAGGVLYLTLLYGQVPWIALLLAGTFSLYGLTKKLSPLSSLNGLTLETSLLFLPALAVLVWLQSAGLGVIGKITITEGLWLSLIGVVTAAPLLTFASAAHRMPLSMLGILQYLSPTIQLLLGVVVYHEELSPQRLIGFVFVWIALIIFWLESWIFKRSRAVHAA